LRRQKEIYDYFIHMLQKTQMVKPRWIKPDKNFLDTGEMLNESLLIR